MGQGGVGTRFLFWENQQVKASGVFGFICPQDPDVYLGCDSLNLG